MRIHRQFKLNGISLTYEGLYEVASSWVKEGKEFEVHAGDFLLDWLSPTTHVQVNTSGSTGQPKSISLRKEHMVNSALATGSFFKIKSGARALLCLSPSYIAGKMMLVRAMVLGLSLDVIEPSSHPLDDLLGNYDFAAMVPLQVQNGLTELHHIKTLLIGGAAVSKELAALLLKEKNSIFATYGMTETITHIAVKKISGPIASDTFEVLPEVSVSQDRRGCLVINAPKVCRETIVTNDLVELVDDTHFKWLGRYDNVINSGGIKLIPEQLEEKLSTVIKNRFFIAGIPDERLGEKMILVIEGMKDEEKQQLYQKIRDLKSLRKFEMPREIISSEQFKETPTGKIQRSKTLSTVLKS
ncbi:MAG: AMP-binding protein [Croceivirga sp.]